MSYRCLSEMKEMCESCPFGHSKEQRHMRNSLAKGRFDEICQSVWRGEVFICHKTTKHDDEGEWLPSKGDKVCAGSLQFLERAAAARRESERRAAKA